MYRVEVGGGKNTVSGDAEHIQIAAGKGTRICPMGGGGGPLNQEEGDCEGFLLPLRRGRENTSQQSLKGRKGSGVNGERTPW